MMNWGGCRRKRLRPKFKILSWHLPRTEENHKNLSQNRSPDQDLNPGPSEYKVGVLTTQLQRSVGNLVSLRTHELLNTMKIYNFFKTI
jgi:hypothetical protein